MKNTLTHLLRWPRRALSWLMRARLAFFTLFVVMLAIITSLYYWETESGVRLSGLLLQILGIAAAAIGIRDTRRMFGKPSFLELVRSWLKAAPGLKPKAVSLAGSSTLSVSTSSSGQIWHGLGQNPDIESRLAAVEANLKDLYDRANAAESAFAAHIRATEASLREEREVRQEADRQIHIKIEAASTDGLHLAAVGVAWIMCGVIMSTAPNELLNLVK